MLIFLRGNRGHIAKFVLVLRGTIQLGLRHQSRRGVLLARLKLWQRRECYGGYSSYTFRNALRLPCVVLQKPDLFIQQLSGKLTVDIKITWCRTAAWSKLSCLLGTGNAFLWPRPFRL